MKVWRRLVGGLSLRRYSSSEWVLKQLKSKVNLGVVSVESTHEPNDVQGQSLHSRAENGTADSKLLDTTSSSFANHEWVKPFSDPGRGCFCSLFTVISQTSVRSSNCINQFLREGDNHGSPKFVVGCA